jgi:hypothetical protein
VNGLTRVLISVVALGACGVAMRFTMNEVQLPTSKSKYHTWSQVVPKDTKAIALHYEAIESDQTIEIKPGRAGRVASTYQGTAGDILRGGFGRTNPPPPLGTLELSLNAGRRNYESYFFDRPPSGGIADLRLPPELPLDVEAYFGSNNIVRADLRGLQVKRFCICDFWSRSKLIIDLKLSNSSLKSDFDVYNAAGETRIEVPRGARGSLRIKDLEGRIRLYINPSAKISLQVVGDLRSFDNAEDLKQRININGGFKVEDAKVFPEYLRNERPRGVGFVRNFETTEQKQFDISVELGARGTLEVIEDRP